MSSLSRTYFARSRDVAGLTGGSRKGWRRVGRGGRVRNDGDDIPPFGQKIFFALRSCNSLRSSLAPLPLLTHEPSLASPRLNKLQAPVDVICCLGVECDVARPGSNEVLDSLINGADHEVNVDGRRDPVVPKRLAYHGSDG